MKASYVAVQAGLALMLALVPVSGAFGSSSAMSEKYNDASSEQPATSVDAISNTITNPQNVGDVLRPIPYKNTQTEAAVVVPEYKDGTFKTVGKGGKSGDVPVTVVIKGGKITSITIGANPESPAMLQKARQVVVKQVLSQQSCVDIETATGATYSSNALIDGIQRALKRAEKS